MLGSRGEPGPRPAVDSPEPVGDLRPTDLYNQYNTTEERRNAAYSLKFEGWSTSMIANSFGVTHETVYRWMKDAIEDHRKRLESDVGADIIADSLLFFDHLEQTVLYELRIMGEENTSLSSSGRVVRKNDPLKMGETKIKFIEAAAKIRRQKIMLLRETSILSGDKDKAYQDWRGKADVVETVKDERSEDDIQKDIEKLLKHGLTIKPKGREDVPNSEIVIAEDSGEEQTTIDEDVVNP